MIEVDEETLRGAIVFDVCSALARLRTATEYLSVHPGFDALWMHVQDSRFLHHRNLAMFLAARPPTDERRDRHRATDLVAAHYFPGYSWEGGSTLRLYNRSSDEDDERARQFLNRHLTHLSTDRHRNRLAPVSDWWHIVEPAAILDGFDRFLEDLRATEHAGRADGFAVELAAARRVIGN